MLRPFVNTGARQKARGSCSFAALLVVAALPAAPSHAHAEDALRPHWREAWAGADVSTNVWLTYTGVTVAPWSGLYEDGWRFRSTGGYGGYRYLRAPSTANGKSRAFSATLSYSEALAGYQARFGELTAKAFLGASLISHDIAPWDADAVVIGPDVGVKGVVELWLNLGQSGWASLDASWSGAHDTRAVRARAGYFVVRSVSVGPEAALNVDGEAYLKQKQDEASLLDFGRVGLFARYAWASGEVSVSAGVLGRSVNTSSSSDVEPYVGFNWLSQF